MSAQYTFEFVTTKLAVDTFNTAGPIFKGILEEIRELSKKKPEATMSAGKIRVINRVIEDLMTFLKNEPEGKYLDLLDGEILPQMSDALLTMVQFFTALNAFKARYTRSVRGQPTWITNELVADLQVTNADDDDDDDDESVDDDEDLIEDEDDATDLEISC